MINGYINTTSGFNYGWICPKCNRVYGPFVQECAQCNFDKCTYTGPTVTFAKLINTEVKSDGQNG